MTIKQQWTLYHDAEKVNEIEHVAITFDRAANCFRNPIDQPMNDYERRLAADARSTLSSMRQKNAP